VLEESIRDHVKTKLEAHAYPREVEFLEKMPQTKTGKILKNELRRMHEKGLSGSGFKGFIGSESPE
jgi:acetyl-CoA synthetase